MIKSPVAIPITEWNQAAKTITRSPVRRDACAAGVIYQARYVPIREFLCRSRSVKWITTTDARERRNEVREKAEDQLMFPEKIKRNDGRGDIGCKLRRMYLMKEDFFPQRHGGNHTLRRHGSHSRPQRIRSMNAACTTDGARGQGFCKRRTSRYSRM